MEESGWVYGALEDVVTSLIRSIVRTISLLVWFWQGGKETALGVGEPPAWALPAAAPKGGPPLPAPEQGVRTSPPRPSSSPRDVESDGRRF